jgi:hypothetical protein
MALTPLIIRAAPAFAQLAYDFLTIAGADAGDLRNLFSRFAQMFAGGAPKASSRRSAQERGARRLRRAQAPVRWKVGG